MEKSDITIIMPAYNSEKTLENSIKSVLNQKFKEWKLIIIDDNSTDNTEEICEKYEREYAEKIVYIKNKKKGVSSARNLGIEMCTTQYIMFLDSDDLYVAEALMTMQKEINDCDLVICGYNRILIDSNRVHKTFDENRYYNEDEKTNLIEKMQDKCLFNQIWNKIYRTDIIKKSKIRFNEDLDVCEDQLFNLEYLKNIKKVKVIEDVLYDYYSNQNGLNFKYIENRLEKKLIMIDNEAEWFYIKGWCSEYIQQMYIFTCLSGIANIVTFKKTRENELKLFIKNKKIHDKIFNIIQNTTNIKLKMLGMVLNIRNYYILLVLGKIMIFVKKCYRRLKYEA